MRVELQGSNLTVSGEHLSSEERKEDNYLHHIRVNSAPTEPPKIPSMFRLGFLVQVKRSGRRVGQR